VGCAPRSAEHRAARRRAPRGALHDAAPHYGWARNKGYGAPEHRAAIREHGPHPEHRTVFIRHTLQMNLFDDVPVAAAGDPAELALVEEALAGVE